MLKSCFSGPDPDKSGPFSQPSAEHALIGNRGGDAKSLKQGFRFWKLLKQGPIGTLQNERDPELEAGKGNDERSIGNNISNLSSGPLWD